jgi:two-component system, HptB-dependent secretion and biofilm response regulator
MTKIEADTSLKTQSGIETSLLTLLLVDDDQMSREMLAMQLGGLFKDIYSAADGAEGFRLFCEHTPDIVLTDQVMPGLSGLDLKRKIRATGAKTPVVLMTSSIDNKILMEAINIGIERFVPKPFDFHQIIRTLTSIARETVNERLLEEHRQQEVLHLRELDAYNSLQQESARRKERHVVRHDLRNQALYGAGGVRWGVSIAYSPHDIMCGDGYSVRNLFDGRQLIFVVDAMGHGMSASLTAMLATSFFNYQVENLHLWGTFTLRIFLKRFKEYLASMLLEDEVLSCAFLLIDLVKEEIKAAVFALPPLMVRGLDGSVRRVRGENPPIGIYPSETRISTISLTNVADILIMTDGVSDALLTEGGSYREVLESDYRTAPTLPALQRRFRAQTEQVMQDDLTLILVRRLDLDSGWNWKVKPDLTPSALIRTVEEFLEAVSREADVAPVERAELNVALTEALTNALEHGCRGGRADGENHDCEDEGALENDELMPAPEIVFSATLWRGAEKPLLIMNVCHNGPGLPTGAFQTVIDDLSSDESGLRRIARNSEVVFLDGAGGRLIMLKTLEGRCAYEK